MTVRTAALLGAILGLAGLAPAQGRGGRPGPRPGIEKADMEKVRQAFGDKVLLFTREGLEPAVDAAVAKDALLAVKLPGDPVRETRAGGIEYKLPYRIGTAAGGLDLVPYLIVEGGAVEFQPDRGPYAASVVLMVRDAGAGGAALPAPAWFVLLASTGTFTPSSVAVERVGQPYQATLKADALDGESIDLTVVPGTEKPGADHVVVHVGVRRPEVRLAAPLSVQGFGLQPCRVDVSTDHPGVRRVALAASCGALSPGEVDLDASGHGTATLFPSGLREAEVRVVNPGLRADTVKVRFVFPFAFLLAALLGGTVGGLVARHRASRKRPLPGTLLRGALNGLLAAVAIAFGINLVSVDLAKVYEGRGFSEGLVFLVAALAAAFGLLRPGKAND